MGATGPGLRPDGQIVRPMLLSRSQKLDVGRPELLGDQCAGGEENGRTWKCVIFRSRFRRPLFEGITTEERRGRGEGRTSP